jgi:hypothetical protein
MTNYTRYSGTPWMESFMCHIKGIVLQVFSTFFFIKHFLEATDTHPKIS